MYKKIMLSLSFKNEISRQSLKLRKMFLTAVFIFVVTLTAVNAHEGQKEQVHHSAPSSKFDQKHDADLDHQAVLGSEKLANEFDELSPEESKRRLRVLAKRMDIDKDGFVTVTELQGWIYDNLLSLDKEETEERFVEIDQNNDGAITWTEYLHETFGVEPGKDALQYLTDPEDIKLMEEDNRYFSASDSDENSALSRNEFAAFQNPEHYSHMHKILVENTLMEKDTNKDGKIDLKEYMGEMFDQPSSEWFATEKERFTNEYDLDQNGFLEGDELKAWLVPDITKTAHQEAVHLLSTADSNNDDKLTIDEIVEAYKAFVGSEATSFGEGLMSISHDEL